MLDELATKRSRKPPETVAPASESELLQSSAGEIKPCEHNARVLIGTSPQYAELHFDEFLSRLRIGARDWTDADDLDLLCWLQSAHGVPRFVRAQARNGALAVAYSRRRDSLREFVERLSAWDGTPRIEHAFEDAWGAPDDMLTRAASRNFFVALIARAVHPGAKVEHCGRSRVRKAHSSHLRCVHSDSTSTPK